MSAKIDVGGGQGVVAVEMAHLPEIETMRVMKPAGNIKDARAVVVTVAKAVGGQITQDLQAAVSAWLSRSTKLIAQDHEDLLVLLEQEASRERLDTSQRRCQALSGPAPIGWSSGFTYTASKGHTVDQSEGNTQLAYLEKVLEEDKQRIARERVERGLITWNERQEAFSTLLEKEKLTQRSSALGFAWLAEIERSKLYHAEEREGVTKWNAEKKEAAVLERVAREQRFPGVVFPRFWQ
jgi:hypothetical protein